MINCPIIVTVTEPPVTTTPNITAIYADIVALVGSVERPITNFTIEFETGLKLSITAGWRNTGDVGGTFTPKITINGQTIYGKTVGNTSKTLAPNAVLVETFVFNPSSSGTYAICLYPN